jgi:hypothetical protein
MRHYYATFNIYKTLDDLYINKKIKNKIFGQEYSGNNKDLLKLYIGDTRPMDQGKYSYKCKMNNNNECILNYISIIYNPINRKIENNETINNLEINSFAEINFGYSNIKGTYDVGKKIFDFLLSLPSFKNKCYIISSRSITIEDEYIKLICNSDTNIYDLPKIIFSFGEENKIQILLTSDLLFYKQYDIYGDKFYYMTRLEFSKLNKNWIIGRPLLNDVNLIYDLEKKYITFIFDENNDLNIINLPNKSFKIIVIKIFEVIGVVLLIFIVLFICFYCYRKRKIKVIKEYMNSNVQRLHDI